MSYHWATSRISGVKLRGKSVRLWCDGSSDRSFVVDSISYFSFQPVFDWCNKGRGMCYPGCGMVHIKEPFLLIGKSPCGSNRFPLSRYLPYVLRHINVNNMLSASLNKTCPTSVSESCFRNSTKLKTQNRIQINGWVNKR